MAVVTGGHLEIPLPDVVERAVLLSYDPGDDHDVQTRPYRTQ